MGRLMIRVWLGRLMIRVWLGLTDTGFATAAWKKFSREISPEESVLSLI
jgi:hypothetical protein